MTGSLERRGWQRFAAEPSVAAWVGAVLPHARRALRDPANAGWWRCGGTWFVGVNALDNDADGAVPGGPPLAGAAVGAAVALAGGQPPCWDRAQVSAVRRGYPRRGAEETEAAFAYRLRRDAAHVDGLLPVGPARRRMIREPHAFILGLPLVEAPAQAAPLVVWEGSPAILRRHLAAALAGHPRAAWHDVDVTGAYHAARREVFDNCRRVALPARPGEAYLLHRLALHGIAPWPGDGPANPGGEGRMIAYFRPRIAGGVADWLAPG